MSRVYDVAVLINKEPFELTVEYEYGDGKTDDKEWLKKEVEIAVNEVMSTPRPLLNFSEKSALIAIAGTDRFVKIVTEGLISFVVDLIITDQGDSLTRESIEVVIAKNYYPGSTILKSTRNPKIFAFFLNRFFENNKFPEVEELRKEMKEIKVEDPAKRFEEAMYYMDEIALIEQKIFSKILKQYKFTYEKQ